MLDPSHRVMDENRRAMVVILSALRPSLLVTYALLRRLVYRFNSFMYLRSHQPLSYHRKCVEYSSCDRGDSGNPFATDDSALVICS